MSYFKMKYLPAFFLIGIGFYLLFQSATSVSLAVFFSGIASLLLGIFYLMIIMVIELFQKDREFNIDIFKKEGYETVFCNECHTENIVVDVFCRYCNAKLVKEDEIIPEEH